MRDSRLFAISDFHFHLRHRYDLFAGLAGHRDDWLLLAGDCAETLESFACVIATLSTHFRQLVWTPGNHELWTHRRDDPRKGVERYAALVDICRQYGVATPEDEFPVFAAGAREYLVMPVFFLYDYSLVPPGVDGARFRQRAGEEEQLSMDEFLLDPHPFATVPEWNAQRLKFTEERLAGTLGSDRVKILVSHYPLLREHATSAVNPFFSLWSGSAGTAHWAAQYRIDVVVYGHTHAPASRVADNTLFHEVSYPFRGTKRYAVPFAASLRLIVP